MKTKVHVDRLKVWQHLAGLFKIELNLPECSRPKLHSLTLTMGVYMYSIAFLMLILEIDFLFFLNTIFVVMQILFLNRYG